MTRRAVQLRGALGLWGLLTGCSGATVVKPDAMPTLAADEGLIVLIADGNHRTSLTLCRDADLVHCVDFGPLAREAPIGVTQVPAGKYCLMGFSVENTNGALGFSHDIDQEDARCFVVAPGVLTYPGHFVMQVRDTATSLVYLTCGWDKRATARAEVDAAFPKLAGLALVVAQLD